MTSFEQSEFKGALAAQHRELINPPKPDNLSSKIPQVALKFVVQRYFIYQQLFQLIIKFLHLITGIWTINLTNKYSEEEKEYLCCKIKGIGTTNLLLLEERNTSNQLLRVISIVK